MITTSHPSQHKIVSIHRIYHIEYLMEDIRVTFKRDMKLKIGEIMIDAKEGDMSSLQRWIAKRRAADVRRDTAERELQWRAAELLLALVRA